MWLRSDRGVTGCLAVNADDGTFHDLRIVLTSSSSENFPSCTARRTPIAATGLLIDAAWKIVSVSAGAPVVTSATP